MSKTFITLMLIAFGASKLSGCAMNRRVEIFIAELAH
jgi:hypothetical protein